MPQSGVNSTMLWLIIMNNTTRKLNRGKVKVVAYANDVVILISEMLPTILNKTLERALEEVVLWATECELDRNLIENAFQKKVLFPSRAKEGLDTVISF